MKATKPDPTYYRQRYVAELLAAERAVSPVAQERHRQLADLYLRKLADPGPRTKKAA